MNDVTLTDNILNDTKKNRSKSGRKAQELFLEKECEVINYNKSSKFLDIMFDGFGIRLYEVNNFSGNTAIVKYKGKIGNPGFTVKYR